MRVYVNVTFFAWFWSGQTFQPLPLKLTLLTWCLEQEP